MMVAMADELIKNVLKRINNATGLIYMRTILCVEAGIVKKGRDKAEAGIRQVTDRQNVSNLGVGNDTHPSNCPPITLMPR